MFQWRTTASVDFYFELHNRSPKSYQLNKPRYTAMGL